MVDLPIFDTRKSQKVPKTRFLKYVISEIIGGLRVFLGQQYDF